MKKGNKHKTPRPSLLVVLVLVLVLGVISSCGKKNTDHKQDVNLGEKKAAPEAKLALKKAEVFGDFIFLIPDGWSRAPVEMEREEKAYLFGNETIHPGGEPSILMIRQDPARYPDASALEKSLALIKQEWSAAHPQAVPEKMVVSGMETLRLQDKIGKKSSAGENTLYKLYSKRNATLYTFALLLPGPNAPWPDYANALFGRLHLREEIENRGQKGKSFSQRLGEAVEGFRQGLRLDSLKAIETYASQKTFKQFYGMEEDLWPLGPAQRGWREFAEQAVVSFGKPAEDQAVVLFFDPWTDRALLTLWTGFKGASVKITDVEMLVGSSLREPSKKSLTAEPAWFRQKAFAPFALGWHTSETIQAFQDIFGEQNPPSRFRTALPALADPPFVTANHVAAALSRSWLRSTLADLFSDQAPTPPEYRAMTVLVEALKTHTLDQLAQKMPGSSKDLQKVLGHLSPDDFNSLRPAAFISGNKKSVLLLSHAENPDLIMSLRFARKSDEAFIDRLDLFSLNAFYLSRKEFGR